MSCVSSVAGTAAALGETSAGTPIHEPARNQIAAHNRQQSPTVANVLLTLMHLPACAVSGCFEAQWRDLFVLQPALSCLLALVKACIAAEQYKSQAGMVLAVAAVSACDTTIDIAQSNSIPDKQMHVQNRCRGQQ